MSHTNANIITRLTHGYRTSQILFVAVRLGLFDALETTPMTAPQLAQTLGSDHRATRMLCDALAALGLLTKERDRYRNTRITRKFLIRSSAVSQCALLLHNAALYDRWRQLFRIVKSGKPAPASVVDTELRGSTRDFARAMESSAAVQATETATKMDLREVRWMLDIGGGPGVYAIAFVRRWPRLRVTLVDCADAVAVANENIKKAKLHDRIQTRIGNAFELDLGGPYDCIFLSNVIHQYSAESNKKLIARAADVLAPKGKLAVKDFILNNDRRGPVQAAVFAINMLVNTPDGDCYTAAEIRNWMRAAGLRPAGSIRLRVPSKIILARKP